MVFNQISDQIQIGVPGQMDVFHHEYEGIISCDFAQNFEDMRGFGFFAEGDALNFRRLFEDFQDFGELRFQFLITVRNGVEIIDLLFFQ